MQLLLEKILPILILIVIGMLIRKSKMISEETINGIKQFPSRYTGGFFSGFEFGMIGVGLFGAIWGIDKLPVIMLVGFCHFLLKIKMRASILANYWFIARWCPLEYFYKEFYFGHINKLYHIKECF